MSIEFHSDTSLNGSIVVKCTYCHKQSGPVLFPVERWLPDGLAWVIEHEEMTACKEFGSIPVDEGNGYPGNIPEVPDNTPDCPEHDNPVKSRHRIIISASPQHEHLIPRIIHDVEKVIYIENAPGEEMPDARPVDLDTVDY